MPSEIDCWGPARATVPGAPLGAAMPRRMSLDGCDASEVLPT